jgi:hypothetical protein
VRQRGCRILVPKITTETRDVRESTSACQGQCVRHRHCTHGSVTISQLVRSYVGCSRPDLFGIDLLCSIFFCRFVESRPPNSTIEGPGDDSCRIVSAYWADSRPRRCTASTMSGVLRYFDLIRRGINTSSPKAATRKSAALVPLCGHDRPQITRGYDAARTWSTNEMISVGANGFGMRRHRGEHEHVPLASSYPDIKAVRVVGWWAAIHSASWCPFISGILTSESTISKDSSEQSAIASRPLLAVLTE